MVLKVASRAVVPEVPRTMGVRVPKNWYRIWVLHDVPDWAFEAGTVPAFASS